MACQRPGIGYPIGARSAGWTATGRKRPALVWRRPALLGTGRPPGAGVPGSTQIPAWPRRARGALPCHLAAHPQRSRRPVAAAHAGRGDAAGLPRFVRGESASRSRIRPGTTYPAGWFPQKAHRPGRARMGRPSPRQPPQSTCRPSRRMVGCAVERHGHDRRRCLTAAQPDPPLRSLENVGRAAAARSTGHVSPLFSSGTTPDRRGNRANRLA